MLLVMVFCFYLFISASLRNDLFMFLLFFSWRVELGVYLCGAVLSTANSSWAWLYATNVIIVPCHYATDAVATRISFQLMKKFEVPKILNHVTFLSSKWIRREGKIKFTFVLLLITISGLWLVVYTSVDLHQLQLEIDLLGSPSNADLEGIGSEKVK